MVPFVLRVTKCSRRRLRRPVAPPFPMKFQLTIARKLLGLSVLAVLTIALIGIAGLYARHFLTVGADRVLAAQEALRHQMQADQAHDALRGDVLAALLAARLADHV